MLIPRWFQSLRAKYRMPDARPQPAPPDAVLPEEHPVDNGVRMHIAANDPAFPAKREAAVEAILAAIDPIAQAHGFTRKARSWVKAGPLGVVSVHLQRSHYGFECYINLGFQPLKGDRRGPWAQDDFLRLGRFSSAAMDALIYLNILEDTDALAAPMRVLNMHALPWLLAQLDDPEGHALPFSVGPHLGN